MADLSSPYFAVDTGSISRHHSPNVSRDHVQGWQLAEPLFAVGGRIICMSQSLNYAGDFHKTDFHLFGLILHGRMKLRFRRETLFAESGDLICIPVGTEVQRTGIGPIAWIYIQLDDEPLWSPLKSLGYSVRKYESADLMYILVRRIIDAHRSRDVYAVRCAHENAEMLVSLLKRELRQSSNEWSSGRMTRIVDLLDRIREHPEYKWGRLEMARLASMSERTLTRAFQRSFNMPPGEMVLTIRMDAAIRMLLQTEMSLEEIASKVGYESTFSFSRLFRKLMGISPGKYRMLSEFDRHALSAIRTRKS